MNCDGDKDYCALCEDGYYLADGVCYSCQGSCLKCTASTTCTKCSGTHYLLDNGRCKTLPSNCVEVDEDGECTKCEYGYRILFGSCFECSSSLFNVPYLFSFSSINARGSVLIIIPKLYLIIIIPLLLLLLLLSLLLMLDFLFIFYYLLSISLVKTFLISIFRLFRAKPCIFFPPCFFSFFLT